jgi:hypothetical protein
MASTKDRDALVQEVIDTLNTAKGPDCYWQPFTLRGMAPTGRGPRGGI